MGYSKNMKEIETLCKSLGLDKDNVWHKTKALLTIYRKVVWSIHQKVDDMAMEDIVTYGRKLDTALEYLYDFAPTEKRNDFEYQVNYLFETKWLIDLIDKSLIQLKRYPDQGDLYYLIIKNAYLNEKKIPDIDVMQIVSLEKTVYYQRKKEAIYLVGIALWGYAIPEIKNEIKLLGSIG